MLELTLRLVFSLAAVLGLLLLIVKFSGRRFRGREGAAVTILHRQALTRASSVSLVSVGERVLLLGVTEHQVSLLTELDPLELPEGLPGLDGEPAGPALDAAGSADLDDAAALPARPRLVTEPLATEPPAVTAATGTGDVVADLIAARAAADEPAPRPVRAVAPLAEPAVVASSAVAGVERPAPALPGHSALAGSVLSVQTWRQAFAAATRRAS